MSRELKKLKGGKDSASKVSNHPNFLKLGERGLKKLVKKIQKENKNMIKTLFKKIQSKWDFWIYCRFFHSIKRICEEKSGWSHIMELHLRDYNQSHPIDEKLKESAELYYNSVFKTK